METDHKIIPSPDVYGLGSYTDVDVLSAPVDARRVFEILAKRTPGFTKEKAVWDTVTFEGRDGSMLPGPFKAPVVFAALHAMAGVIGNELLQLRDQKPVEHSSVKVNTDHAGLWLGMTVTAYVNDIDISTRMKNDGLMELYPKDLQRDAFAGLSARASAIYPTRDPRVWYHLHGSLGGTKMLQSLGIATDVKLDSLRDRYDYLRKHIESWSPDELEMHMLKYGFCGNICHTPQAWRQTEMAKCLHKHPLLNYRRQSHVALTPPVALPILADKRPLAGIKVLELVRNVAGPTVGNILASFGADVIRVNCSALPDLNMMQLSLNAGKRTIDLDINRNEDMTRLRELLEDADVFIQGFRPKVLAKRGLSLQDALEVAARRNRGIIYVEVNCYGPDGPFAERPGWQQTADAATGISYILGKYYGLPDGQSLPSPLPISDMGGGLVGAVATLMAIRDRTINGGSYHVISSLVATIETLLDPEIGLYPKESLRSSENLFQWKQPTPDQFVFEYWADVVDAWKKGIPEYVAQNSPFMVKFEDTPWGCIDICKPVPQLGDEEATPHWKTGPVPFCYHERDITWL